MQTYKDQLRNPRWQKKRLAIFERDGWQCQRCGERESELHVHHTHYAKGKKPWEYPDQDLVTLCYACHHGVHACEEAMGIVIPWDVNEYEAFEILLLERIVKRHSDELPDIYYCKRLNGEEVVAYASGADFKLSEWKKGTDWLKWANSFREEVRAEVMQWEC